MIQLTQIKVHNVASLKMQTVTNKN